MQYVKVRLKTSKSRYAKSGYVMVPAGLTKVEQNAYLSGELPKTIKVPLNKYSEGRRGFMKVLGYEVRDVLRATSRSQWFIIYQLRKGQS